MTRYLAVVVAVMAMASSTMAADVNGGWTAFGLCAKGTTPSPCFKSRSCTNPAPEGAGLACSGNSTMACDPSLYCIDGTFSQWTTCSQSCGTGGQTRTCSATEGGVCPADADGTILSRACNQQPCVKTDGGWSDWGACSKLCGGGTQERTCTNPAPAGGGAACSPPQNSRSCATFPCQNCTTTDLTWWSECTRPCNGGTWFRTRKVKDAPSPGGEPCPALRIDADCNTQFCRQIFEGRGYFFTGPIAGPAKMRYQVGTWGRDNVDVFVFDAENWEYYLEDIDRNVPYNWGYRPVAASLNVDNADAWVTLEEGKNYYFVVDHTPVGAANGNGENGEFQETNFSYKLSGDVNPELLPEPVKNAASAAVPAVLLSALLALAAFLLQ